MSRLITISGIMAVILGLSLTGILYARDVKTDFETEIQAAAEFCGEENGQELMERIEAMESLWKKREGFLSFYVRHDQIEQMSFHLAALTGYARDGAFENAQAILSEMHFLIGHIYERELPNWDNLF